MGIYPTIYEGLRAGWLRVDDLGPLAGVQVWVRLARPCQRHPEPGVPCRDPVVHEFGTDGTDTLYRLCDPDGPAPEVTGEVAGLRVLWADGHTERLGPEQEAYLHPHRCPPPARGPAVNAAAASTDGADNVRELHDRLIAQVEALVSGKDWARYLSMAARFQRYSASNVWLILAQRPDLATTGDRVGGYQTWKRLGRHVNRGAKGIAILAPCVYRARGAEEAGPAGPATAPADSQSGGPADATTESAGARVVRGFKVVHVFAQSDTTGEPLPELRPVLLDGEGALWDALAAQVAAAGFTLSRGDCGSANGYTDFAARTVVVAEHLSGRQADKTLAHELGHALFGHGAQVVVDRDLAEIEAESVAYIVCNALGIDSASYSLPYVAGWSGGSVERIRRTAERVVTTAQAVLAAMAPAGVEALAVSA